MDDAENRQPSRFSPPTRPTDSANSPRSRDFSDSDYIQTEIITFSSPFWRWQSCKNPNMPVSGLDFKPAPLYFSLGIPTEKFGFRQPQPGDSC